MNKIHFIYISFFSIIVLNCSGNEKSKVIDIYADGSPKKIAIYIGNPPKMELSKILFISSFGDTAITINVQDGDTLMPEIKKEIIKEKFDNGKSMIVEHWIIHGYDEKLVEIHYFDDTGDILKVDDRINERIKKYAELHPNLEKWLKPEDNPFKNYLNGQWDVISSLTGKKYLSEFKGGTYISSEVDISGKKYWEEMYSINYNWNFNIDIRMLNKGFPKNRIKPGKRFNYQLKIDTKDRFEMINEQNNFIFTRKK